MRFNPNQQLLCLGEDWTAECVSYDVCSGFGH